MQLSIREPHALLPARRETAGDLCGNTPEDAAYGAYTSVGSSHLSAVERRTTPDLD